MSRIGYRVLRIFPAAIVIVGALIVYPAGAAPLRVRIFSRYTLRSMEVAFQGSCVVLDGEGRQLVRIRHGSRIILSSLGEGRIGFEEPRGSRTLSSSPLFLIFSSPFQVRHGEISRSYSGVLEVRACQDELFLIVSVPLEEYTAGVVASEMIPGVSFAALQAQAVVSRSFARSHVNAHPNEGYDFCDLTHCQSFQGLPPTGSAAARASASTKGLVLIFQNGVLPAFYHSTCGGRTAASEEALSRKIPGISSIEDSASPGELAWCFGSPHFRWNAKIASSELLRALAADIRTDPGDNLRQIWVISRGISGRATEIMVLGSNNRRITGYDFWLVLGRILGWGRIESTDFEVERKGDYFFFRGRGLGHGMGLCQWGAAAMARRGFSFKQILMHYFPDVRIGNLPDESILQESFVPLSKISDARGDE